LKILKDFYLTVNFTLFNWFKNLYNAWSVISRVKTLKYIGVFSSADLSANSILGLVSPGYSKLVIVTVLVRILWIYVLVVFR